MCHPYRVHCSPHPIRLDDTMTFVIQASIGKARVEWVCSDEIDPRSLEVFAAVDEPLNHADDDDDEEGDDAVV